VSRLYIWTVASTHLGSLPIQVIREILSELRPFVAIKMGSTDFFLPLELFLFRHPSNSLLQRNLHFLPLECVNPTINAVDVFSPNVEILTMKLLR
jgi:hypothetical protein